jgi:glycine cleavage system aminomethyltransferase T
MTAPKQPIESFGPELLNTLIEGTRRRVVVPCTFGTATRLRLRLHQLRTRMRELNHPLYPIAAKCKVTIEWDENKVPTHVGARGLKYPSSGKTAQVQLVVAPHDDDFAKILTTAGVDAKRDISGLLTPQSAHQDSDSGQHNTSNLESLIFPDDTEQEPHE